MHLTPRENERLTIYTAAELARRRLRNGVKLNYPEAVAVICDELLEQARGGEKRLTDVIAFGSHILTQEDVLEGVEQLMPMIQVEGMFPDGSKLITVHDPIRFSTRKELEAENYLTM
ncbi:urease subunit gamma [Paenibacillus darwinianus]|uniref:Urease subunit gamma n=1 Tax=Paenibacillus darwinianus TaxID=1380763 RepID=A0A9W5RZL2_9BACL|nr:urease subunit gamma [Paenibacillus darwinianus]EXX86293.1 urease subunit gamma [Paenibacillus darwinianus]EXX86384.1 urease subunit gamma [Paenibacillus darwinianus]EXX90993.1 urease subunit gamma [Paenibacillus darwinianus]